jgi:hypothetical protein
MVEVYLEDEVVQTVNLKEPYDHPESSSEISHAVRLVRSHQEAKSAVDGLEGHGILYVPMDPHEPSFKHRCINVTFTNPAEAYEEMPVLFSALVDLRLQKVISFNQTPCGEAHQEHQESKSRRNKVNDRRK